MKAVQLDVMVEQSEGALLRVLGTVERRGFRIEAVHAQAVNATLWHVKLTVAGERPIEVLCRQLERLVDVYTAQINLEIHGEVNHVSPH